MTNSLDHEDEFFESLSSAKSTPFDPKWKESTDDEDEFFNSLGSFEERAQESDKMPDSFMGVVKKGFKEFGGSTNEILRGAAEGMLELGEMVSPTLPTPYEEQLPKEKRDAKRKEALEYVLPSERSAGTSKRERFGKLGVTAAMGPGGLTQAAVRTALAVEAGKWGQEIGGETGKLIGEILPYIAPSPTRILQAANANQERLLNFGRRMGMSEETLTKAFKPESWWRNQVANISTRRGRTRESLQAAQEELGTIYDQLHNLPHSRTAMNQNQVVDMLTEFGQTLHTMDTPVTQVIMQEVRRTLAQPNITGSELMNLYHRINGVVRQQPATEAGRHIAGQLGRFNNAIRNQISNVSPELGVDFALANELYANYAHLAARLRPTLVSDILSGAKAISAVLSAMGGYLGPAYGLAGMQAGRKFASELLINPRFQNLGTKMIQALSDNNVSVANQILQQFKKETKKENPEIYEMLKDENFSVEVADKPKKKQAADN